MRFIQKSSIRWVSVCLLMAAARIPAQEINISHCLNSCPDVSRPTNDVSLHHVFAAAVIPETGEVEWVAYRVLPESIGIASLLPRWWEADRLLVQDSLVPILSKCLALFNRTFQMHRTANIGLVKYGWPLKTEGV